MQEPASHLGKVRMWGKDGCEKVDVEGEIWYKAKRETTIHEK